MDHISLEGKTPLLKKINSETREPLIKPDLTIFEYIQHHIQLIFVVALFCLFILIILNYKKFTNILSDSDTNTTS